MSSVTLYMSLLPPLFQISLISKARVLGNGCTGCSSTLPSRSSPIDVDDVDFVTTSIKNERETDILVASGSKRGSLAMAGEVAAPHSSS